MASPSMADALKELTLVHEETFGHSPEIFRRGDPAPVSNSGPDSESDLYSASESDLYSASDSDLDAAPFSEAFCSSPTGREIHGQGTPEKAWQDWGGLECFPELNIHDLVDATATVWVVAPHPDDEVLACGGLLRQLVRRGLKVKVVAVTDGAASHPGSALWTPAELARIRAAESRKALDKLGLPAVPLLRIGLDDGRIIAQAAQLRAYLLERVTAGDLVLATWDRDGHPDHEAVGAVSAQVASMNDAVLLSMPVWMWHWASPGDVRVPWQHALRLPLAEQDLSAKSAAVACYCSQLEADASTGNAAIVGPAAMQRLLRQFEVFFL